MGDVQVCPDHGQSPLPQEATDMMFSKDPPVGAGSTRDEARPATLRSMGMPRHLSPPAPHQEIEITALVGLHHMVDVQLAVAPHQQ